jgi:hypothetical protein
MLRRRNYWSFGKPKRKRNYKAEYARRKELEGQRKAADPFGCFSVNRSHGENTACLFR